MRSSIIHSLFVTIGAALVAAVIVPSPAAATTIMEAIKLCSANPDCAEDGEDDRGKRFCVGPKEPGKCDHLVVCPGTNSGGGDCRVVYIQPGGGKKVPGGNTPANVLTGAVTATPGRPAGIFTGGILDNRPGFSSQGPGATSAPASAPAAPPPGKLY